MLRAAVALALALGLAQASSAQAAPDAGKAAPATAEDQAQPPGKSDGAEAAPAGGEAPAADEETSPAGAATSGDEAPDQTNQGAADSQAAASDETAGTGEDADGEADSALHGLTCLEGDATGGRRKGVQKRDFLKRHRFELAALGGYYASDALSSTYSYGGALAYYPSEDFGVEVLVTRSPVKFRLEEPFNSFDRERHFQSGVAWQWVASMLWSPIHAKFRFSEKTIIHGDIFAVAGAGRTMHDSVLGLTWEAGGGIKLYFSRFVTFRLDLRDFVIPQEVLGRGRVTNNVMLLAGLSVWFG